MCALIVLVRLFFSRAAMFVSVFNVLTEYNEERTSAQCADQE